MAIPSVREEELRIVHSALRVAVPLEQVSPMVKTTLAMIAHCWRGRVPAHLWGKPLTPVSPPRYQPDTDFKRRAAGDFD